MPDELRFIDPAFSCEVVLRNESKALYQAAESQFNRLKEIRDLGLIGHFGEIGVHSRHNHLVGMLRLFEKLLIQPSGSGLPKEFLWSFWCRLCFGQTGHAAFSYDSEKAVLLACHVDRTFKQEFINFLQPVIDGFAKVGNKKEEQENRNNIMGWLDSLIKSHEWTRVYLWVAALKLLSNDRVLGILSSILNDANSEKPGFDLKKALELLLNPQSRWDLNIKRLNTLDSVVRDLSFTGRVKIILDVDHLTSTVNIEGDYDWSLIDNLNDYLTAILYHSPGRETQTAIFQRTTAHILTKHKINIESLFGMDDSDFLTDEDLKEIIIKQAQGRELFNENIRNSWETWIIRGGYPENIIPINIEKSISGMRERKASALLTDAYKKKIICYKMGHENTIGVALNNENAKYNLKPVNIIRYGKRLMDKYYLKLIADDIIQFIFEGLLGCKVEYEFTSIASHLAEIELDSYSNVIKYAKMIIKNYEKPRENEEIASILAYRGIEMPLSEAYYGIPIKALAESKKNLDDIVFNKKRAIVFLFYHILEWQGILFGKNYSKRLMNLIVDYKRELEKRIKRSNNNRARNMECYVFLDSLIWNIKENEYRISLPNIKLINEKTGKQENEYDVITITLDKNETVIWIWGVTTNKDIEKKRGEDDRKIQRIKDKIGDRWKGKVRSVKNYVHYANGNICLEIDGKQDVR